MDHGRLDIIKCFSYCNYWGYLSNPNIYYKKCIYGSDHYIVVLKRVLGAEYDDGPLFDEDQNELRVHRGSMFMVLDIFNISCTFRIRTVSHLAQYGKRAFEDFIIGEVTKATNTFIEAWGSLLPALVQGYSEGKLGQQSYFCDYICDYSTRGRCIGFSIMMNYMRAESTESTESTESIKCNVTYLQNNVWSGFECFYIDKREQRVHMVKYNMHGLPYLIRTKKYYYVFDYLLTTCTRLSRLPKNFRAPELGYPAVAVNLEIIHI